MPYRADTLPVETLSHICGYVSGQADREQRYKNLHNFSLVCSAWRHVAQRELFAVVLIDESSIASSLVKEIATNTDHSHLGAYIAALVLQLPYFDGFTLPPDFPQFLRRLTTLRGLKLFSSSGVHLFDDDPSSPELHSALAHVFSLPNFTSITSNGTYFPLRVLSYCPNLEKLLVIWSRIGPPNLDDCDLGKLSSTSTVKLKVLQLIGRAEHIEQFSNFVMGPRGIISTSNLREMTLGFERTLPKGSGTIFSHFETVEDLMIMFIINAEEDLNFGVDDADISALRNLHTFRIRQHPSPPRAGPPDGLDYIVTGSLMGQWFLGILANLPNPENVRELEYILEPPVPASEEEEGWLDAIEETAGEDDHAFDDIYAKMDSLLTTEFTGLRSFTFSLPWVPHANVAQKLTELHARGILKQPPETS